MGIVIWNIRNSNPVTNIIRCRPRPSSRRKYLLSYENIRALSIEFLTNFKTALSHKNSGKNDIFAMITQVIKLKDSVILGRNREQTPL